MSKCYRRHYEWVYEQCADCDKRSPDVQDLDWHIWGRYIEVEFEVFDLRERHGRSVCLDCLRAYVSDGTDESYFSQCASGMA